MCHFKGNLKLYSSLVRAATSGETKGSLFTGSGTHYAVDGSGFDRRWQISDNKWGHQIIKLTQNSRESLWTPLSEE